MCCTHSGGSVVTVRVGLYSREIVYMILRHRLKAVEYRILKPLVIAGKVSW